jgi:multiple sugar transport system permease protein
MATVDTARPAPVAAPPRPQAQPHRRRLRGGRLATLLAAVVVAVIVLFPVYWMVMTSLLPTSRTLSTHPPLLPPLGELDVAAYTHNFTARPMGRWFLNSTLVTLGVVAISVFISVFAGYALSRFRGGGPTTIGYVMLLARMLPGTMLAIPMFVLFGKLGLVDNLWGLILADATVTVPFTTWLLKNFFDAIPREMEEAAEVDGTGQLGALWRVILPTAAPGMAATAVYAAILAWSDLLFARTLITQPDGWTMTVGVTSFVGAHDVDWNGLMAAGTLSVIPIVILFAFLEPFLVRGMASGATKG